MAELAKVYGPQAVPFELMVSLSSLPGKREIMDKMKSKADESGQAQQQVVQLQQQMVQLEAALKQAQVEKTQAEAGLTEAKTQTEMHRAALGDRQQNLSEFNAQMMAEKAQFDAMNAAAGQQTGVPQGQA
jgi:chromosome segregation ATPase